MFEEGYVTFLLRYRSLDGWFQNRYDVWTADTTSVSKLWHSKNLLVLILFNLLESCFRTDVRARGRFNFVTGLSVQINFSFVISQANSMSQTKLYLLSIAIWIHVIWAAFFACRPPDRLGLASLFPLTMQLKPVSIMMTLWSIQLTYLLASLQSTSSKAVTALLPETEISSMLWIWYKQCRYLLSVRSFRGIEMRSKFAHVERTN
jgi:hypothetical protein